ncbi:hypothetical protein IFM58399_08442 [Aspergillus lentulus]|uniref:DUF2970 domain-containing protein n=1 Tax=Aspergillus lentulus TaxID=293939 RepID=A0ABQ0ZUQ6_ASPLE|nr:uncharacterized protein IFM58399_08442 [Aspergillus lentulus]GFF48985.1 hypothetical protein IFM58399_08442 [Aspergillus lentulus]GFF61756.1 hypothetical protein IFM62136_05133 [Aspergillus lentulus]GFF64839.1 hypothetical protein IFM60648_01402 [Aspergillus lentulus]
MSQGQWLIRFFRFSVGSGLVTARATPRKWVQLWRDNRDSAHWLTFWAVIVFGALGTLLALLQVILQAVQIAFR